ncbi:aldehyde dehydrogenase [Plasmopara halstedii]|uniref:Aldehyde dehydrogenase n=1 Tax=Plasmopara halstedii TaxID=4781 RepID=A0A0P1A6G6_PLAHL|nr:aldehyde dehydrogenase [Plasmopara halstedii]CEG36198.1 aldehyde dehydrogenase [Plasmopara halstedii]|eukprot:XP_024572567.1 aldehyde dehydrogenase [Plasmopara halstedii]
MAYIIRFRHVTPRQRATQISVLPGLESAKAWLRCVCTEGGQSVHRRAVKAQVDWKNVSLSERQALCTKWIDALKNNAEPIAHDISGMMGKPVQQALNEINGTIDRAKALIYLSNEALCTDSFPEKDGLFRQITHEPVGVVYVIAPWNYPLMTAVNSIIPAVLAGNTVLLKHSPRTPLCGEHYQKTFEQAGFPQNVLQSSLVEHDIASEIIQRSETAFVSFTGSVQGGRQVQQAAAQRSIDVTLELGGNDAGYVTADADAEAAAEGLVDGVCYNAGQSCCGVERIYVHESKYDRFLEKAKSLIEAYILGDPTDAKTTMGPMALPTAPKMLDAHVKDAVAKGALQLTGSGMDTDASGKGRFYTPTLLANCNGSMDIMMEESFGPIVGVERVVSDAEAVEKINHSKYGLTASVFTSNREHAMDLGSKISAGTVYMNRCDVLDPFLPWTGNRDSGKGISLSKHGFRGVTKLKSWNFRI